MAFLRNISVVSFLRLSIPREFLKKNAAISSLVLPNRTKYTDWRMRKDALRRQMVRERGAERVRINCIRKNTLLPHEIREVADREVAAMPRDSNYIRIRDRCAITSRPRESYPSGD